MTALAWLALAIALVPPVGAGLLPTLLGLRAAATRRIAVAAADGAFLLALAAAALLAVGGPVSRAFVRWGEAGGLHLHLGVHVDALTVVMLLTVTAIGAVVTRFAVRTLEGDPLEIRFARRLAATLGAVLLLVIAGNLVLLFAAWVATSLGLNRLLTFYPERPAALLAARKKFLVSRLGDAFLLAAFVLLYRSLGTTEFSELFARAHELSAGPLAANAGPIAFLLVLGAMTKSAQLPFHTWLPDTMETPTPVSALMHAGIVNAGGYLLIRMSPVLVAAPTALWTLALVAGLTAVFASVVMLTQTDVKRKLAWSTVSQMGFMMLQCGLGAFSAATLHLVGHSLYKGHAFLAAGSTVNPRVPQPGARPPQAVGFPPGALLGALAFGVVAVGLAGWAYGLDPLAKPGFPVLAAVLALGVAQLLLTERQAGRVTPRRLGAALRDGAALALAYFLLTGLVARLLEGVVPARGWSGDPAAVLVAALVTLCFAGAFALQASLPALAARGAGRSLYVHAANGFYLGVLQDRWVQRLWPVRGA